MLYVRRMYFKRRGLMTWRSPKLSIRSRPCRRRVDFVGGFDFIHMRGMMTCISDPRSILAKAYAATKPGGYLEVQDAVFPYTAMMNDSLKGTALDIWGKTCVEGTANIGRAVCFLWRASWLLFITKTDSYVKLVRECMLTAWVGQWTNTPNYRAWMFELGFEDVREKIFETPINTWPRGQKQKELCMWWQADLLDALGTSMAILTRAIGWLPEEVDLYLVQVRKDVKNKNIHAEMLEQIVLLIRVT